jgi:drug/metabolite transporter (DMT)-like permease
LITLAVGLVIVAAVFHATWNVLLKAQLDPLLVAGRASWISAAAWTPLVLVAWLVSDRPGFSSQAWALAGASAVLEVAYFVFLSAAYRRGGLTQVYAIARGTAPLLAVLAGVIILREHLTGLEIAGVVSLLCGLWLVRTPVPAGSATLPALVTGMTIAAYSAVDSAGVHAAAPWLYGFVVWFLTALLLVPVTALLAQNMRNPAKGAPRAEPAEAGLSWPVAALIGMLMTWTFLIILIALRLAPLAVVAPLRESAIVLVTIWGIWRMDERHKVWLRLLGAGLVATGAAIVAVN